MTEVRKSLGLDDPPPPADTLYRRLAERSALSVVADLVRTIRPGVHSRVIASSPSSSEETSKAFDPDTEEKPLTPAIDLRTESGSDDEVVALPSHDRHGLKRVLCKDMGGARGISKPSDITSLYAAFSRWVDEIRSDWPDTAPKPKDIPDTVDHYRMIPWRLRIFLEEYPTPQPSQYNAVANALSTRFFNLSEVIAFYRTEPWAPLAVPPSPVSFRPTDLRFVQLYQNACRLYETMAQAMWECTHFVLIHNNCGDGVFKRFGIQRRKRRAEFRAAWNGHIMLLRDVFRVHGKNGVDADLLLDPFFCWPPAFGIDPLIVNDSKASLADAVKLADMGEPRRLYFRRSDLADSVHSPAILSRITGKFFRSRDDTGTGDASGASKGSAGSTVSGASASAAAGTDPSASQAKTTQKKRRPEASPTQPSKKPRTTPVSSAIVASLVDNRASVTTTTTPTETVEPKPSSQGSQEV